MSVMSLVSTDYCKEVNLIQMILVKHIKSSVLAQEWLDKSNISDFVYSF